MSPIITVAHLKGGVGKTTVAVHLADALVRRLRQTNPATRVLVIDCDPQRGATTWLAGAETAKHLANTIATWLAGKSDLQATRLILDDPDTTPADRIDLWAGIDLIPSSPAARALRLRGGPGSYGALRDHLPGILDATGVPYGALVIDTGAGDTDLTSLGLIAADGVLCVTATAHLSVMAIEDFGALITQIRGAFDHVRLIGVVANNHHPRRTADKTNLADLSTALGDDLWAVIPSRAPIEHASDLQAPMRLVGPRSAVHDITAHFDRIAVRALEALS